MSTSPRPSLPPPWLSAPLRASLRLALALLVAGSLAQPARAQDPKPYALVVVWTGLSRCYVQAGLLTFDQSVRALVEQLRKQYGLEPSDAVKLMKTTSFEPDVKTYIDKEGGCTAVVEAFRAKARTSP